VIALALQGCAAQQAAFFKIIAPGDPAGRSGERLAEPLPQFRGIMLRAVAGGAAAR